MKKLYTSILSVIWVLFLCIGIRVNAQITSADLQQKVDSMFGGMAKNAPGSAVLVVKNKEIILNKGYGLANLEYGIPITPKTVFDLASLSKQFAGYAISLLVEQGKISENDDIRKYIPEFPEFDQTITIKHLLHHTSGLRDWTSTLSLAGRSFEDVISFDHILRMAYRQKKLNFEPGSQYAYSNTGYNILAELVQRVTGVSFRTWTDQNIFQPLKMPDTFFLDNHREVIPNRARGYFQTEDGPYRNTPNNLTALGSSSLYATTDDLAKWVIHLMYPPDTLQPVVERMLQTDTLTNGEENTYAYGIDISEFRGTPWISHSGSWAFFRTYLVLLPEYDLSVVVLNNNGKNASRIARKIASFYVPESHTQKKKDQIEKRKAVELPQSVLNAYTGTYKLGKGWYVHLTKKDGTLWTRATNEEKFPMTALSDTVFSIKAYGNRTMRFYKNESNKVTHLVYNDMVCPKVSDHIVYTLKNPEDYTGDFFSDELHTRYKVQMKDGQLYLWSLHHGEITLELAWEDDFFSTRFFARNVEFQRDTYGRITGFFVSHSRAKNQFFRKLDTDKPATNK